MKYLLRKRGCFPTFSPFVQMEGGIGRIVQYHLPIYHGQTHLQDFFGQNRLIERFFKYSKNSKVNVAVLLGSFKTGSS